MPTGGGKSLTFMLLARCSPGGVTIVVIPLTALEGDIVRRCKESDIKTPPGRPNRQASYSLH
ncbi:hypothetical protein D6C89_10612 [Aureobasidium pullulans]|nr:hypothetical protein D6C89_10612 [Aureobasidium pullulans]